MNIIQIVSDTFRRDHLGAYGNGEIRTKYLNKFAEESMVFDRAYIASFPTIPNRHDLFTGRYTFTYSTWSPLPREEVILSQLLRQAGYVTMLIVDTFHMIKNGYYFDRGFDGWWWIRGQEVDRYMTHPTNDSPQRKKAIGTQYLQNVSSRRFESDYFVAQTMTAAVKWLELNYDQHEKFFLHVDTFDPHEPWDPPLWYTKMYEPTYEGEAVMGAAYVPGFRRPTTDCMPEDDLNRIRAMYAGEVTLVDRWIGMLLQKIEDLGLLEDTAVMFTTDHGTYLGEHGYIHKRRNRLYEEVAHIPMIIRLPDSEGTPIGRTGTIVQSPDLTPTILELAEVDPPPTVQAKSLLPIMNGEEIEERDIAVSANARTLLKGLPYGITVTSKEWALLAAGSNDSIADDVEESAKAELYHLTTDPQQARNLIDEKKEIADELQLKMVQFLESLGTKPDLLDIWKIRNE